MYSVRVGDSHAFTLQSHRKQHLRPCIPLSIRYYTFEFNNAWKQHNRTTFKILICIYAPKMTDAVADKINDKLYEYYKQFPGPAMCPTQFEYSNCNDDKWVERLLEILMDNPISDSVFEKFFRIINDQNIHLNKENEEIKRANDQNQKLTRIWTTLQNPNVIKETTLDDFLGTSGQPPQQQPPPQPPQQQQQQQQPPQQQQQQSKGLLSWFGIGGAWDLAKMNSTPNPAGCPIYAKKLDFNKCSDEDAIVDLLLNDARILQYLINHDETNMMKANKELKLENENLKRSYPNWKQLIEDNRELAFNINKAHRIAGTKSPVILDWKMGQDIKNWSFNIIPDKGGKTQRKTQQKTPRKTPRKTAKKYKRSRRYSKA